MANPEAIGAPMVDAPIVCATVVQPMEAAGAPMLQAVAIAAPMVNTPIVCAAAVQPMVLPWLPDVDATGDLPSSTTGAQKGMPCGQVAQLLLCVFLLCAFWAVLDLFFFRAGRDFVSSMHWSLSQFTMTTTRKFPHSDSEVFFTYVVTLSGLVTVVPLILMIVIGVGRNGMFPKEYAPGEDLLPNYASARRSLVAKSLFKLVLWIIFLAMLFKGLGWMGGYDGWILEHGYQDSPLTSQYLCALHWVTSQYTFAESPIVLGNSAERGFAIFAQFVGFVTVYPLLTGVVLCVYQVLPGCIMAALGMVVPVAAQSLHLPGQLS